MKRQDAERAEALGKVCGLMSERFGRELAAMTASRIRQEAELREIEHAAAAIGPVLPQSASAALRRLVALEDAIRRSSLEISRLRQLMVISTARRDMLCSRAGAMRSLSHRRSLEQELLEQLRPGKSEASS